jgi:hypothetical protein
MIPAQPPSNPFAVFTPEGLNAERVVEIFSRTMPGLDILGTPGHAFVFGARGSGKSILLRYLEPDCQRLVTGLDVSRQKHFALYVSFRETEAKVTELARFEKRHGDVFFNEHLLVLSICATFTTRLLRNSVVPDARVPPEALHLFADVVNVLGGRASDAAPLTVKEGLERINRALKSTYTSAIQYVKLHSFRQDIADYSGSLLGFDDLLLPYVEFIRVALDLSAQTQILLFLDDADNLTETQTRVVNSWIARRLSTQCSIKVAAQITAYKTRLTTYDTRIEAPHDYHEINITDLGSRSGEASYFRRIASIITQRLSAAGMPSWADKFFPEDHYQKLEIEREGSRLKANWVAGEGRGHRARDDVQRYARPNYIASLGGTRKSRSKYSYSGFDQLVHISSGVPRFFLEAAANMYDLATTVRAPGMAPGSPIDHIPPEVQNSVIRDLANQQFIWDLRDLAKDVELLDGTPQRAVRLHNLILGLGSLFEAALLDKGASERKFFSFAFSDQPSEEVEKVLELGVRYGYFFRAIIGRKEGFGRTPLYVLSRRLAPLFNLDPMGFAGYKFMRTEMVQGLMDDPDSARKALRRAKRETPSTSQARLPLERDR